MKTMTLKTERELKRILRKYSKEILAKPNVLDVMIGYRFRDGELTDEACIAIHVSRKLRPEEITPENKLPAAYDSVPVDVLEIAPVQHVTNGAAFPLHPPLKGGIPISNSRLGKTGTMGAVVKDATGKLYGISNHHVLVAGHPRGKLGDTIETNAATGKQSLGTLTGSNEDYDFAYFSLSPDIVCDASCSLEKIIGLFAGMADAKSGMKVFKSGATTGVTYGTIAQTNGKKMVIAVDSALQPPNTPISDHGDSGSVWVTEKYGQLLAVALHYEGNHYSPGAYNPALDIAYAYSLKKALKGPGLQV